MKKALFIILLFLTTTAFAPAPYTYNWIEGDSISVSVGVPDASSWWYLFTVTRQGRSYAKCVQSGRALQQLSTNSPSTNSLEYAQANNSPTTIATQADGLPNFDSRIGNIIIWIGTNDVLQVTAANTIANFTAKLTSLINFHLSEGYIASQIIVINIPQINESQWAAATPVRIGTYNTAIQSVCTNLGVSNYVDMNTLTSSTPNYFATYTQDGLHPNTAFQYKIDSTINAKITTTPPALKYYGRAAKFN